MSRKALRCALLLACGSLAPYASGAWAEQLATGRYKGSIEIEDGPVRANPRPRMIYFELSIQRFEGGSVAGAWSQSPGPCRGDQPVEGRLEEGRLSLTLASSGSGECKLPPIRLTLRGGALEGTSGRYEIRLRR